MWHPAFTLTSINSHTLILEVCDPRCDRCSIYLGRLDKPNSSTPSLSQEIPTRASGKDSTTQLSYLTVVMNGVQKTYRQNWVCYSYYQKQRHAVAHKYTNNFNVHWICNRVYRRVIKIELKIEAVQFCDVCYTCENLRIYVKIISSDFYVQTLCSTVS